MTDDRVMDGDAGEPDAQVEGNPTARAFDYDRWAAGESMMPHAVLGDTRLTPAARLVYLALLSFMFGNKTVAWPSFRTLERCTGFSRETLGTAFAQLEHEGLLEIVRDNGRTNRYELTTHRRASGQKTRPPLSGQKSRPGGQKSGPAVVRNPDLNHSRESGERSKGAAHAARAPGSSRADTVGDRRAAREAGLRASYAQQNQGVPHDA